MNALLEFLKGLFTKKPTAPPRRPYFQLIKDAEFVMASLSEEGISFEDYNAKIQILLEIFGELSTDDTEINKKLHETFSDFPVVSFQERLDRISKFGNFVSSRNMDIMSLETFLHGAKLRHEKANVTDLVRKIMKETHEINGIKKELSQS